MPIDDVKVLLVIGRGRSGTTILDNLLGELDSFFSAGQLIDVWRRLEMGFTCGCGKPVAECELWSSVIADSLRDSVAGPSAPSQVAEWQEEVVRLRYVRRLRQANEAHSSWSAREAYSGVLTRVYRSLAERSGARVIVDSSKRPALGALLQGLPGISPYVVHLVRDPRAVAYSYQRIQSTIDRQLRHREGAVENSLRYMYRNLASQAVRRGYPKGRSLLLRYEDFVTRPAETLRTIARLVGEDPHDLPVDDEGIARLGPNHTAAGNPSRFKTGTITLRLDDEWIAKQRKVDQLTTTTLTLPLLLRYGYPISPRRSPPSLGTLRGGRRGNESA